MKTKLLATCAMLAITGAASAQSSVTLFGVLDANIAHGSGSIASRTRLHNSGISSSRIGFRGTEDLGGGLYTAFWIESQMMNDDGTGQASNTNNQTTGIPAGTQGFAFNRKSTVSLGGTWGELRLGRDYVPHYLNLGVFDPFNNNGVGASQTLISTSALPTAVRASNSVGYLLPPNMGGLYGQGMYYVGENASNAADRDDGRGASIRVGYTMGNFDFAVASGRTRYQAGDHAFRNVGASWTYGSFKLLGQLSRNAVGAVDGRGWVGGAHWYAGAGVVRLAISDYETNALGQPRTRKLAVGYTHQLSKRTALYTTYARVRNSGGASTALNTALTAPNAASSGYDIGIRHDF